jgi:hypothetical protein
LSFPWALSLSFFFVLSSLSLPFSDNFIYSYSDSQIMQTS